jgi:hypothetical protein
MSLRHLGTLKFCALPMQNMIEAVGIYVGSKSSSHSADSPPPNSTRHPECRPLSRNSPILPRQTPNLVGYGSTLRAGAPNAEAESAEWERSPSIWLHHDGSRACGLVGPAQLGRRLLARHRHGVWSLSMWSAAGELEVGNNDPPGAKHAFRARDCQGHNMNVDG